MGWGLRQGDPLSPLLFVIVAKALHVVLKKAVSERVACGVELVPGFSFSHLQFADVTILFFDASIEVFRSVQRVLFCFQVYSGLQINFRKSSLVAIGVDSGLAATTRRKVELAWISYQSARQASLRKRRVGLLKKVEELTTLCGIKSCLVHNDLEKLNKENKEAEAHQFMLQMHHGKMLDDFNVHELEELICFGETRRTTIRKPVEFYK
ncbi:hypothetical protein GQ457_11G031660 [Hibiscus cannabinus]